MDLWQWQSVGMDASRIKRTLAQRYHAVPQMLELLSAQKFRALETEGNLTSKYPGLSIPR